MTPEGAITAAIRRYLLRNGCWEVKCLGGLGQRAGVPDVLACVAGTFVGVEVKQPGRKPTANQSAELAAIRAAGGVAIVATSLDDVIVAVSPLLAASGATWQPALVTEGMCR